MQLLGGDQREPVCEVKPHLVAENGKRAGSGPVILAHSVIEHALQEVVVLAHGRILWRIQPCSCLHQQAIARGRCDNQPAADTQRATKRQPRISVATKADHLTIIAWCI
jgi:hypothetical protein